MLQIEYMHCNSESPANSFATCHVYYRKSLLNFIILFNQYIDLLHIPTGISSCRFLCTVYYYDELEKKKETFLGRHILHKLLRMHFRASQKCYPKPEIVRARLSAAKCSQTHPSMPAARTSDVEALSIWELHPLHLSK